MNDCKGLPMAFCVVMFCSSMTFQRDCSPRLGSCVVCDSMKGIYRADALALAYREAQDSALPYSNNIFIQEARISTYEKCLALLYNNLEDSVLFGLRSYHPPEANDTMEMYKVTLQVSGAAKSRWRTRKGKCGYKNINNILDETGLTPIGKLTERGQYIYADYTARRPINKIALQKRFSAQRDPDVIVMKQISPQQYIGMMDYKSIRVVADPDSTYILLTYPFGPGMPPELQYPTATDYYHVQGCSLTYVRTDIRRHQK